MYSYVYCKLQKSICTYLLMNFGKREGFAGLFLWCTSCSQFFTNCSTHYIPTVNKKHFIEETQSVENTTTLIVTYASQQISFWINTSLYRLSIFNSTVMHTIFYMKMKYFSMLNSHSKSTCSTKQFSSLKVQ